MKRGAWMPVLAVVPLVQNPHVSGPLRTARLVAVLGGGARWIRRWSVVKKEAEAIEAVAARLATIANSVDEASGGAQGVFAARIISELIRGPNKALDHRLYELEQAFWRRAAELTRKPRKRRKR